MKPSDKCLLSEAVRFKAPDFPRELFLSKKSIRGRRGLQMWQCPDCGTISSTFIEVGDGTGECKGCGETLNFYKWQSFVAYLEA